MAGKERSSRFSAFRPWLCEPAGQATDLTVKNKQTSSMPDSPRKSNACIHFTHFAHWSISKQEILL